jgi:hypothetical protein
MSRLFWIVAFAAAAGGCGGADCGRGTHESGDACVPDVACGDGTHEEDGACVPTCGEGTHVEDDACVSDVECAPGTHLEGDACVVDPDPEPPSTWTANVLVSAEGISSAEPSVAADADGHVFVAFMDTTGATYTVVLRVSDDWGSTFQDGAIFSSADGFAGDVSLAATPGGDAYLAFMDYHYGAAIYPPADTYVVASHDHGATWGDPVQVNVDDGTVFNDRPWVAIGPDGDVHVHFTSLPAANRYETRAAHSEDGGATWSTPVRVATPLGSVVQSFGGGTVTVGGEVVVPQQSFVSSGDSFVGFAHSADGEVFRTEQRDRVYFSRDLALAADPIVAASPTGRFCLAFQNAPERDYGIFAAVGDDGVALGETFEVDDGSAATQTMHWMTADGDGRCHLVWLDNRSRDWEVWGATIRADGTVSPNERVSDASFTEDGARDDWLGDFISIAVGGDTRYAVWTDTRSGGSAIYLSTSPVEGPL